MNIEEIVKVTLATFPFGAHVAVVEVDTETGKVRLTRLVRYDTAGNPVTSNLADDAFPAALEFPRGRPQDSSPPVPRSQPTVTSRTSKISVGEPRLAAGPICRKYRPQTRER